jgi:hypothetical protein
MLQQTPIQLSQLTTHFYWNEKIDYALMTILKDNWDSLVEYVVSLFNTFCNKNVIKIIIRNCIQYLYIYLKNNTNFPINEILSISFTLVSLTIVF